MRNTLTCIGWCVGTLFLAACTPDLETGPSFSGLPDVGSALEQPQFLAAADGSPLLTWTARSEGTVDIFLTRMVDGVFEPPIRVNEVSGAANRLQIDEMRPAVAAGPGDRIAIAWTDANFNIQLTASDDGGQSFRESIRLNRDEGDALQEFPSIGFDLTGTLHAVWLDPRAAGPGLEEPADLYYTSLSADGELGAEVNLTADQESSVCGCCLPHVAAGDDGTLTITFRNTTPEGYRDPFRITRTPDGFTEPQPVSTPVWRIDACPVAGPLGVGNATLWLDASTGTRRLLSAVDPEATPDVVFADSESGLLLLPPRLVSGLPATTPVVLVPMSDSSRLIAPDGDSWRVVADDLPFWVTSATVYDGTLLLAGTSEGFQFATLPFNP